MVCFPLHVSLGSIDLQLRLVGMIFYHTCPLALDKAMKVALLDHLEEKIQV